MMEPTRDWAGILRLSVEANQGRSFARTQYHEGALRVLRPHYLDGNGHLTYTVINPGGAYFGADSYLLEFEVKEKASLTVTTQSATKVYKTPQGPAFQQMQVQVGENAYFEYLPDQLIMYQDGEYQQTAQVEVHPSSTTVMAEIVTPGWAPDGTHFAYKGLNMRTELRVTDEAKSRRLALDFMRLYPAEQDVTGIGILEGYTHTGQLMIASAHLAPDFLERIHEMVQESATRSGISVVKNPQIKDFQALVVRSLANTTADIAQLHKQIVDALRAETINLTPLSLRKQ